VIGERSLLSLAFVHVLEARGFVVRTLQETSTLFDRSRLQHTLQLNRPRWVINTASYRGLERAEQEPELAFRYNRDFPALLADLLRGSGCSLVSFSSDLVFDGSKQAPYSPEDRPVPGSVYARSKLAGERAIAQSGLERWLIIRTSCLFGPWDTNFVHRMIQRARSDSVIPVAHDHICSPTYTLDLAAYTLRLLECAATGVYHVCNSGEASWCELAAEALSTAGSSSRILPVSRDEQGWTRAGLPRYSVLDVGKYLRTTRVKPRPWLQALKDYLYSYESDSLRMET
jgi:dTDP-4-dehydrorhamnose reductase